MTVHAYLSSNPNGDPLCGTVLDDFDQAVSWHVDSVVLPRVVDCRDCRWRAGGATGPAPQPTSKDEEEVTVDPWRQHVMLTPLVIEQGEGSDFHVVNPDVINGRGVLVLPIGVRWAQIASGWTEAVPPISPTGSHDGSADYAHDDVALCGAQHPFMAGLATCSRTDRHDHHLVNLNDAARTTVTWL